MGASLSNLTEVANGSGISPVLLDLMPPERYTSLSKKNIFSLLSRLIGFDNGSKVIWWFEVDGTIKFPLPAGIYTVTFRLHLGKFSKRMGWRVCGFEHTHGWDIKPVRFELFTTDGQEASFECCLDEMGQNEINGNHKRRCWIDYRVGEFIVSHPEPATEVQFSIRQIDCTHSIGGLCVD
ncbi:hypothetical protein SAY87_022696 [Trapa incisa]|uniref:Uncharacterized protein n=1 Tax=Trapa incisa TaxID=236973 RepID=A0AAN7KAM1_9MYRT|nr:hypothetical protein SAY87_022696 [Trapa incisa]